jgi:hypothetical protein
VELHLHSPDTPSWCGAQLKIKHSDNYTFAFYCSFRPQQCTKSEKEDSGEERWEE